MNTLPRKDEIPEVLYGPVMPLVNCEEEYLCGPAMPLMNSGNWNPDLHPRNELGEFVYTDGGLHGRRPSHPGGKPRSNLTTFYGTPPNSQTFKAPDGQTFLAPAGTDFGLVYSTGKLHGSDPFALRSFLYHFGWFDFQRNRGNGHSKKGKDIFYPAYAPASNYAVGVYLNGAGFSLRDTLNIAGFAASQISSNAGDPSQSTWWTNGWNAATSGNPNGR